MHSKRGEPREKSPAAQGGNHGLPRAPQWCCTGAAGAGQLTGCGADAVLAPHGPAAPGAARSGGKERWHGGSGSSRAQRAAPPARTAARAPEPGRAKRLFAARLKVVTRRALNRLLLKQRFQRRLQTSQMYGFPSGFCKLMSACWRTNRDIFVTLLPSQQAAWRETEKDPFCAWNKSRGSWRTWLILLLVSLVPRSYSAVFIPLKEGCRKSYSALYLIPTSKPSPFLFYISILCWQLQTWQFPSFK